MDEASSPYDKALLWLKEGVDPSEIELRLTTTGLDPGEIRLLLSAAANALREAERTATGSTVAPSTLPLTAPPPTGPPVVIGEPSLRQAPSTVSTVLKVLGGLAAFFTLLCLGFVFFVAVVCGHH
jgi:hypothetical protein